ncbi:hypothetical protein PMI01_02329 [Caulobacter sp. AP07]|uniref:hypothetical protein n=1 Tax=Caulobacter sp. AP07 TaxID=1144304 RepID=UPI000271E3A6|nr:hypothetical protein [Caulobacter sp. AP07]EJL33000.1 hypothetical protein PMI01_02329 [Caulobacter sp. AP07]
MSEVYADRTPKVRVDGTSSRSVVRIAGEGMLARRNVWTAALLLGLVVALIWPAQRVFRLPSSVPFDETPTSPRSHPTPSAALIDQTRAVWAQLDATLGPCDQAVARVDSASPNPGQAQATARRALAARDACRRAGLSLLAIRPPQAAADSERAAFSEALTRCQYVYLVEGNSHGRLAEALRTRAKGAAKFEAWADVQEADLDAMGCRVGFIMAARQAGLPLSLFQTTTPIAPVSTTRSTRRARA